MVVSTKRRETTIYASPMPRGLYCHLADYRLLKWHYTKFFIPGPIEAIKRSTARTKAIQPTVPKRHKYSVRRPYPHYSIAVASWKNRGCSDTQLWIGNGRNGFIFQLLIDQAKLLSPSLNHGAFGNKFQRKFDHRLLLHF